MDIIRVLRVLEYTGRRDAIEKNLSIRQVKGSKTYGIRTPNVGTIPNAYVIREAILGDIPICLLKSEVIDEQLTIKD